MELFLNSDGSVTPEWIDEFSTILESTVKDFHQFLETVSKGWEDDLDWWASSFPSRNTFVSPLYYNICGLLLTKKLIEEKKIDVVKTDSFEIYKILKRINYKCKKKIIIKYETSLKIYLKKYIYRFYTVFIQPVNHLSFWLWAKTFLLPKIKLNQITILSFFVIGEFKECKDRYYPGLLEDLSDEQQKSIYFFPVYSNFKGKSKRKILKSLLNANRNIILKENYLKFVDYIYAWLYIFRAKKFLQKKIFWHEIEVSELLSKEFRLHGSFYTSQLALLHYRFVLRLKENGLKIQGIINFFENQIQDKCLNRGISDYFKNIHHIGYEGYSPVTPLYLSCFPTSLELRCRVIPPQIALCGDGYITSVLRYLPDYKWIKVPLFRTADIWKISSKKTKERPFTFLLALSHIPQDCEYFISLALMLNDKLNECKILIKPHPIISKKNIEIIKNKINKFSRIQFVNNEMFDILKNVDFLFSTASGTCVEALALGIEVGLLKIPKRILLNPIPESIPQNHWTIVKHLGEAFDIAKKVMNSPRPKKQNWGMEIKSSFYEPITLQGKLRLLGFHNQIKHQ